MSSHSNIEHVMERRAAKLAGAIKHRIEVMVAFLAPDGRPIFTTKVSGAEALDFWRRHRTDEVGMALLQRMTPEQVMELDARLAAGGQNNAPQIG